MKYPKTIGSISQIRQFNLASLSPADQDKELAAFGERLREWELLLESIDAEAPGTVSVEIPVFRGSWLIPTIESVLYQSSTDWTLSLVWDGGDDLSRRILELLRSFDHPKLRPHFQKNAGVARAHRFLSANSSGEFILTLDHDDMLDPMAVERLLSFARSKPWSGIVRARRKFIDEAGQIVDQDPWFPFEPRHFQQGMVKDIHNHCHPTFIRRSCYKKTSGWDGFQDFFFAGGDCDIYLKVEEVGSVELLDEVLYYYRLHGNRLSHSLTPEGAFEMWRRLADQTILRRGLSLKRVSERPPFEYEGIPRPRPTVDLVDVVIVRGAVRVKGETQRTIESLKRCGISNEAIQVVGSPDGPAAGRNHGFRSATRPIVLFIDSGAAFASDDGLRALLEIMHEQNADLVGPNLLAGASREVGTAPWLPAAVLCVRREVVLSTGGFDEQHFRSAACDVDFCLNARSKGFNCVYAGGVSVTYHGPHHDLSVLPDELREKWNGFPKLLHSDHAVLDETGGWWSHFKRAETLFQLERWSEAADGYQRAIELKEDVSWSFNGLGNAFSKLNRWEDAVTAYRRANELKPDFYCSHENLGHALAKLGRREDATAAFQRAIELKPDAASLHYSLGDALFELGRWQEAADAFRRAAQLDPDRAWTYNNLGNSLLNMRQWEQAAEAYKRAVALSPDLGSAHHSLGDALIEMEAWENAVQAYRSAMQLRPDYMWTHFNCGVALSKLGRWPEAVSAYERAIELDPDFASAQICLADSLMQVERWAEGVRAYRRAAELQPDRAWTYNNLGNALSKLKNWRGACGAYQRALALDYSLASAQENLGDALYRQARWGEAIHAYTRAVELQPDSFAAHFNRGNSLFHLQRWAEAAVSYQRAAELRPNDPASHNKLGEALFNAGRIEAAVHAYMDAVRLGPDQQEYYCNLGDALAALDRWEEAAALFGRALAVAGPGYDRLHYGLGNALQNLGRWDASVVALRHATELRSDIQGYFEKLGISLLKCGALEEAAVSYARALALGPGSAAIHHAFGDALLALRQFEEAAAAYRSAIALRPDFSWSHNNLGNVLMELQQWSEAADAYMKAIALDSNLHWVQKNLAVALSNAGRLEEAVESCRRIAELNPEEPRLYRELGDALVRVNRLEEASAAYQQAESRNPAWTRGEVGKHALRLERWFKEQASFSPAKRKNRFVFVLDSDYGELTTVMCILSGQDLRHESLLLMPTRLYITNSDTLPGRTHPYASVDDIIRVIDKEKPEIVFLCSAYLFSIHAIMSLSELEQLVSKLRRRGCEVVTADPFLGTLANTNASTVSISIPENASEALQRVKREQDLRLIHHFSESFRILKNLVHIYPAYSGSKGRRKQVITEVQPASFFNSKILTPPQARARSKGDKPHWFFMIASRDYETQAIFHGKDWFIDVMLRKLEQTQRAGRHAVFVGPYDCVQTLIEKLKVTESVTLLSFCAFPRFCSLLLSAEYAFYWNSLSHSMLLRLVNEAPLFQFDKGHLVRNVKPLYPRIVDCYYQGWDPIYLDQENDLEPKELEKLAAEYRKAARRVTESLQQAPAPVEMIREIQSRRKVKNTKSTKTRAKNAVLV